MSPPNDAGAPANRSRISGASDEDLMLRVATGDEFAFRVLAERSASRVFAIARRIAGNDADAEEIVQEAMIRVWTSAPRWRPEAAFWTWLYRIAVNLSLNRRRQKSFLSLDAAVDAPDPTPAALEKIEKDERDTFVAAAISRLPGRQRAALVLTYYEGLSNAETAEVLDATISSVESLLIRAKRALRAELGQLLETELKDAHA